VRSPEELSIWRWSPNGIRAEPLVTELYDSLAVASQNYVPRPFFTVTEVSQPDEDDESYSPARKTGSKVKRVSEIRSLIEKRTSLNDMAEAAGVKVDRVLLYIEEFLKAGEGVHISYLMEGVPDGQRIRAAFEEHGLERLKPAFEALNEEYSFTELRTVRCVMMAEEGI